MISKFIKSLQKKKLKEINGNLNDIESLENLVIRKLELLKDNRKLLTERLKNLIEEKTNKTRLNSDPFSSLAHYLEDIKKLNDEINLILEELNNDR